jgi:hypothetical protein
MGGGARRLGAIYLVHQGYGALCQGILGRKLYQHIAVAVGTSQLGNIVLSELRKHQPINLERSTFE